MSNHFPATLPKSKPPPSSGDDNDTDGTYEAGEIIETKVEPQPSYSSPDVPDGGLEALLVVLGVWCTSFCSFGWINSIGIWQEYYQNGPLSSYSAGTIAWIPSLQIFFMMAMGPIVGKLFDTYGPRHLVLGGTFLHVFGLMMASISTSYYQILLSQGVCSAIGVSAIFQPSLNCIPDYFNRKRGAAYGILSSGSSVGGIVFPIMVSRVIPKLGYGWTMRVCAFMILGLLAIANVTVRKRVKTCPTHLSRQQIKRPFKEPVFIGLLAGMFLLTFGIWVPVNYLTVEAIAKGMDTSLAQYLVAMFNAGSLFGRMTSGFLADKVGKFNIFIACCYTTAVLVLAMWLPSSNGDGKAIGFAVLFGFFSGAYISLIGALVVEISPPQEIGLRMGLAFFVSSFPGLVTSPIAGAILDSAAGGWVGLKVFSGVFCAARTTCFLASRIAKTGWKLKVVF